MLEHHEPRCDIDLQARRQRSKTAVLRVFNYYRVFLSFSLLLLFIQVPGQELVGKSNPDLFQGAILAYIGLNTLVSMACLVLATHIVARRDFILGILTADVIMLCLMLYASGGVESGLANFLVFPVAYAGVLVHGRVSVVVAAIAVILGFYSELNLMMHAGGIESQRMFNIGMLGVVLFAVNVFFQYLTVQLRRREEEVTTLERLNEMRSLAERKESELETSNRKFEILLDSAGDGVLGLDLDGHITFANPRAGQLLTISRSRLAGRCITEFVPMDEPANSTSFQRSSVLHQLEMGAGHTGESAEWRRDTGEVFPVDYSCKATTDHHGDINGAVVVFQDVTDRKQVEQEMHRLANYDGLTNLVNRGHFHSNLERSLAKSRRSGDHLAVLLLDLDHFKFVNDQYGHDAGDEMLRQVSHRMLECIRSCDTAARLGGDEFAILLADFGSAKNLANIARSLIESVAHPVEVGGRQLDVSASIGIAVFDRDDITGDDLMKCADTAMYAAKADGRNAYRFFRPEMQHEAEHTQRIQMALQNAVNRNEFHVHYQPIVCLDGSDSIDHSEALLRWTPSGEDPISPDIFVPIAEGTGKICEIGDWVLKTVLGQISTWHAHTGIYARVAINVSTRQLGCDQFRQQLLRHLKKEQLPAHVVEIELTETTVMHDPETVLHELNALHDMGVQISIDDFGTGYSSLDYLRRLPVDFVKIDKSFTQGIGVNQDDENIIKVIVAIAKAMKLRTIAEGIETEEQLRFLRELGCDLGQGFLFSRPLDSSDMAQHLIASQAGPTSTGGSVTALAGRRLAGSRFAAASS